MSKYFNPNEMKCKCGCGFIGKGADPLAERLDKVRDKYGKPIRIVSWSRCEKHNREVGGEDNSAHMRGYAVDIDCQYSRDRFILVSLLLQEGFKRIGIYKGWVHADIDETLDQQVMWVGK